MSTTASTPTRADALALFADLIAEGSRDRAAEKKTKAKAKAEAVKTAKTSRQLREALPVFYAVADPTFESKYQTAQIILQSCDCCGSLTRFVGAVHTHQRHKRVATTWREIPAPLNTALPLTIRYHEQTTPMCASCLSSISHIQDALTAAQYSDSQLSLF